MKKCTVPETRRKMETAFNSRCIKENSEILEKLVVLREEHAKLLGYPCHAAYEQEVLMAANPSNVESFFNNLLKKLLPVGKRRRKKCFILRKKKFVFYVFTDIYSCKEIFNTRASLHFSVKNLD